MNMQSLLGNFALILFILMVVTGVIWFYDKLVLAQKRKMAAEAALAVFDERNAKLKAQGIAVDESGRAMLREKLLKRPAWVEYSGSFFPVIAAVFIIRSFLWEPFRIPSSSMVPTLQIGDMILVSKYSYGIRLPVMNKKIIDLGDPQRGDVVVFKFPKDTSLDYIKRVVGVGGDRVEYRNKKLIVNGVESRYQPLGDYLDTGSLTYSKEFEEEQAGTDVRHPILNDDRAPSYVPRPDRFPNRNMCTYHVEGFTCTVPQGYYFMMGDNRDNSLDSRYWGFVPDDYIVGKAFLVWMNLGDMTRIGGIR